MTHKINFNVPVQRFGPNSVRDYNIAQGVSHPSDLTVQIIRDYNIRYITVENSSPYTPVGISIVESFDKVPIPPIKFSLAPGEIRHLGVNPPDTGMSQYIHILDLKTGKHVGEPAIIATNANQFVLREGINRWNVQKFKRATYNASH